MKVTVKTPPVQGPDDWDRHQYITIEVDGKQVFSVGDGEPEDMTMGRDLSDAYGIPYMLKKAWQAGRDDETFEIEEILDDDD